MKSADQKPKRGRPQGPPTVRFSALLFPDQLETLDLLTSELEGGPSVAGLVRTAVQAYIDVKLRDKALRQRIEEKRSDAIRLVR
jgi:hypothetical protein